MSIISPKAKKSIRFTKFFHLRGFKALKQMIKISFQQNNFDNVNTKKGSFSIENYTRNIWFFLLFLLDIKILP